MRARYPYSRACLSLRLCNIVKGHVDVQLSSYFTDLTDFLTSKVNTVANGTTNNHAGCNVETLKFNCELSRNSLNLDVVWGNVKLSVRCWVGTPTEKNISSLKTSTIYGSTRRILNWRSRWITWGKEKIKKLLVTWSNWRMSGFRRIHCYYQPSGSQSLASPLANSHLSKVFLTSSSKTRKKRYIITIYRVGLVVENFWVIKHPS